MGSGAAFAISSGANQSAAGTFQRWFGFLRAGAPSGNGQVRATVGTYATSLSYSVGKSLAATVQAVIRTRELYADRSSLRVTYALIDSDGEPVVSHTGLSVNLELAVRYRGLLAPVGPHSLQSFSCALPNAQSGVGECSGTVADSLFGATTTEASATVSIAYDGVEVSSADAGDVSLGANVVSVTLAAAGMLATLPKSARFVDDEFEVQIQAHTGPSAFVLKGWSFFIQYDVSVLSLVSSSFTSVYKTPTVAQDAALGTVSVVTTDLAPSASMVDVQDQKALELAVLRFRVVGGEGVTASHALNGTAGSMVNQGTQRYLSNEPMAITDGRVGQHVLGELVVEELAVIGALAYFSAPSSSFVNMAALDGMAVSTVVQVVELYNRAELGATEATTLYRCASSDVSILDVVGESCSVTVSASQSAGGKVTISVFEQSTGGLAAQLRASVWFPQLVSVSVVDVELQLVDCAFGGFQQTTATALASFGGNELLTASDLDVSTLVSFASSNAAVATVSSRTVSGVSVGSATVRAVVTSSSPVTSAASLTVSAASMVTVEQLRASVVTSIGWDQGSVSIAWQPANADFSVTALLSQSFSSEGQQGDVLAYAIFSDGSERELPSSQLLVTPMTRSVTVSHTGSVWRMQVAVGAVRECGDLVQVQWSSCNRSTSSGLAAVDLQMPSAVAVRVSILASRLTIPGDSAMEAPISIATSAVVSVQVDFDDGSSQDFSDDSRTQISVVSAFAGCAQIDDMRTLTVLAGALCAQLSIVASVPTVAPGLEATASTPLARFTSLQVWTVPYPSFSGYEQMQVSSVGRVACSDVFQRTQLRASAQLSDGSSTDVTSSTVATSTSPAVLGIDSPGDATRWRLVPSAPGSASVTVSFSSQSAVLAIDVLDEPVAMSSVSLSVSGVSASQSYTFAALVDTTRESSVHAQFADGTQIDDVLSANWLPAGALVTFATSDAGVISSGGTSGEFTLRGNSEARTMLSALSACDAAVRSDVVVAANLLPAVGDVDLGQDEGLQFQQAGERVLVAVHANAADGQLVNYQVEVEFDPAIFYASDCSSGEVDGFTCTLNDPLQVAKLIASDTSSSAKGSSVSLGSFSLRVDATAVTLISGSIVELVRKANGGAVEIRTADVPITAGRGYASVSYSGRRRVSEVRRLRSSALASRPRHELQSVSCTTQTSGTTSCLAGYWGDVSGDCKLSSYDVLWAQEVYLNLRPYHELCPWAQEQLDPTRDGQAPTVEDAIYLQLAVSNKYRFLADVIVDSASVSQYSTGALDVIVRLLNDVSEPASERTTVRVEIGFHSASATASWWEAVGAPVFVSGASNGTAGGNWLATASNVGNGGYHVAVYPQAGWPSLVETAGIAVMVETQDAEGNGAADRNFPFLGSSASPYAQLASSDQPFRPYREFEVLSTTPTLPSAPDALPPWSPPLPSPPSSTPSQPRVLSAPLSPTPSPELPLPLVPPLPDPPCAPPSPSPSPSPPPLPQQPPQLPDLSPPAPPQPPYPLPYPPPVPPPPSPPPLAPPPPFPPPPLQPPAVPIGAPQRPPPPPVSPPPPTWPAPSPPPPLSPPPHPPLPVAPSPCQPPPTPPLSPSPLPPAPPPSCRLCHHWCREAQYGWCCLRRSSSVL